MITVDFYKNGFEINGHSNLTVCTLVTMTSWACASAISSKDISSKYYTSSYDNSKIGYSHLMFDNTIENAVEIFEEFKYHITEWCKKEYTDKDIIFRRYDQLLNVPDNFKEIKGIS